MARDNTTNPWGDAANQAVGAMYKYYMSQPTQADALKQQYMQSQIDRNSMEGQMDQRLYEMGGYTGMPASAQEYLMTQKLGGDSEAAKRFENIYVTKPTWQDFGDKRAMVGVNGPMMEYQVGAPPRMEVNKEGREYIPVPSIPSQQTSGASQMGDLFTNYLSTSDLNDPLARSQAAIAQRQNEIGINPYQSEIPAVPMDLSDVEAALGGGQPTAPNVPIPFGDSKSPVDAAKQDQGRAGVTDSIAVMAQAYNDLKAKGGAVSSDQKWLTQNVPNYLASTGIGQMMGRAVGTDEQALRDLIATQKPTLMGAVRQASDMGVKGMDSEKELQFYLNALGDTSLDVNTSLAALQILNDNLGLGAERLADPAAVEAIRQKAKQSLQISPATTPMNGVPDFDNMSEDELDRFIAEQNGR